jgi:hypothetical protein
VASFFCVDMTEKIRSSADCLRAAPVPFLVQSSQGLELLPEAYSNSGFPTDLTWLHSCAGTGSPG